MILILGNGISRLEFTDYINNFDGEVWACNFAYRDFPSKITRLTGHGNVLEEAEKFRDKNGYSYDIYSGVCAKNKNGWKSFTVSKEFLRDSGSSLAAQALHEGNDILLCGFDFGGPDIYSAEHWRQDKKSWVKRWAEIIEKWGTKKINFLGYDHLPFLKNVNSGTEPYNKYWRLYHARKPHIPTAKYRELFSEIVKTKEKEKMIKESVYVEYPNGYRTAVSRKLANILIGKGAVREIERTDKVSEKKTGDTKRTGRSGSSDPSGK